MQKLMLNRRLKAHTVAVTFGTELQSRRRLQWRLEPGTGKIVINFRVI